MFDLLKARVRQGHQTSRFPRGQAQLPARFRGRPVLDESRCKEGCRACADSCPTQAIATKPLRIDLGDCLFCTVCQEACPEGAIVYTPDHRLAARSRSDLVVSGAEVETATALDQEMREDYSAVPASFVRFRLATGSGCAESRRRSARGLRPQPFRNPIRWSAATRRRYRRHGPGDYQHGVCSSRNLRGGARAQDRDRRRGLRDQRRPVRRCGRLPRRRAGGYRSRPLHTWMPPPPSDHPRRGLRLLGRIDGGRRDGFGKPPRSTGKRCRQKHFAGATNARRRASSTLGLTLRGGRSRAALANPEKP